MEFHRVAPDAREDIDLYRSCIAVHVGDAPKHPGDLSISGIGYDPEASADDVFEFDISGVHLDVRCPEAHAPHFQVACTGFYAHRLKLLIVAENDDRRLEQLAEVDFVIRVSIYYEFSVLGLYLRRSLALFVYGDHFAGLRLGSGDILVVQDPVVVLASDEHEVRIARYLYRAELIVAFDHLGLSRSVIRDPAVHGFLYTCYSAGSAAAYRQHKAECEHHRAYHEEFCSLTHVLHVTPPPLLSHPVQALQIRRHLRCRP